VREEAPLLQSPRTKTHRPFIADAPHLPENAWARRCAIITRKGNRREKSRALKTRHVVASSPAGKGDACSKQFQQLANSLVPKPNEPKPKPKANGASDEFAVESERQSSFLLAVETTFKVAIEGQTARSEPAASRINRRA